MGRLSAYATNAPQGRIGGCRMAGIIDGLDPEDRTDLIALFNEPMDTITCATIGRALDSIGVNVGYNTLLRHRRTALGSSNGCKCSPNYFQQ